MTASNSNNATSRLRIAIVGGGIGGLALATFLASKGAADIEVDLYEANASLTELGAGVGVWLRTWRILKSAGLVDGLERIAPPGRDISEAPRKAFEFRSADRGGSEGRSFYTMEVPFGVLTLHRADFQQVLATRAIPPATPHFGKKLVSYGYVDEDNLSSELVLSFADGSTARADVLIGADGIRSPIRGEMFRRLAARGLLEDLSTLVGGTLPADNEKHADPISDLTDPIWSGTNVYRCLIPLTALEQRFPSHRASKGLVVYIGKDKHVLAFPIMHTTAQGEAKPMVNLVAFVSEPAREGSRITGAWVRPAPAIDLLSTFRGWEDEVQALLELVENPLLWAIHTLRPLPCFSDADGRVALLGDAAHAMTPHQGAGGGQAIEDAYVLSALLAHPHTTRATLPSALRAYDAVRVPEAQRVVESSRRNGRMYELNEGWDDSAALDGVVADDGVDEEMQRLRRLAANIMTIHQWEWAPVPEEDQPERAVRLFEEALAKTG